MAHPTASGPDRLLKGDAVNASMTNEQAGTTGSIAVEVERHRHKSALAVRDTPGTDRPALRRIVLTGVGSPPIRPVRGSR